ncbi:19524_t:CDS:1, partial [Cetraspora pellucida]
MSESNLSKAVLDDICRGLGLPTDGVKADLVQRIKDYTLDDVRKQQVGSNETIAEEMNLEEQLPDSLSEGSGTSGLNFQARSLQQLVQNTRQKGKAVLVETDEPRNSVSREQETRNFCNIDTEQVPRQSPNKRRLFEGDDDSAIVLET